MSTNNIIKRQHEVVVKIGGEAGFGIKVAGLILGKALFNNGLYVFGYSEYPSLIRGGHNVYQLNISCQPIASATQQIDVLVALNQATIEKHQPELSSAGVIIHDNLDVKNESFNLLNIPLSQLAEKAGGLITKNMVALGAVMAVLGLDLKIFKQEIAKTFMKKGEAVVKMNKQAAELGYNFTVKEIQKQKFNLNSFDIKSCNLGRRQVSNNFIMTANEATAYGIIQAGCEFYSAYPMTPATSIMHVLAAKQKEFGLVVHQTEDEISAIGAAIGASVVGVRAATGTSGGGFALMNEQLGLAAITETPLVLIEAQRTAPATGLPTWTEQGDLQYVIHASHGEFPRIVLAPGDAEEAFYMIQQAFNWAEKFQVPVIFLLDKFLSESDFILEQIDINKIKIKREGFLSDEQLARKKDYKRYEITANGVSARAVPGQAGGVHVINSDDHDEYGYSTEGAEMRKAMVDKRFKKVKFIQAELPEPKLYGDTTAELTLVGWGSVKNTIIDAMQGLKKEEGGLKVNFLHLNCVWPFPVERVKAVLGRAKNILLIENNKTGQLGELIRQETGIEIKNKLLKYDGRPFFREEIVGEIIKMVS